MDIKCFKYTGKEIREQFQNLVDITNNEIKLWCNIGGVENLTQLIKHHNKSYSTKGLQLLGERRRYEILRDHVADGEYMLSIKDVESLQLSPVKF